MPSSFTDDPRVNLIIGCGKHYNRCDGALATTIGFFNGVYNHHHPARDFITLDPHKDMGPDIEAALLEGMLPASCAEAFVENLKRLPLRQLAII